MGSKMLPNAGARSPGDAGRGVVSATAAAVLRCCWALLLLASRPTAVEGFAVVTRGGLNLSGTRYSRYAAMGADPARTASCLFFMGGGGGVEDEERAKGGDQAKKNVLRPGAESGLGLPAGYPSPHASRSNIRRRAMGFLRGGSKNGDFNQDSSSGSSEDIRSQVPDSIIGETLSVQGTVEFKTLLRIDGHFEGEVVGDGSLIIGPTAEVISNLSGLNEVYVEGILIGDCSCNKMQIRGAGCVTGNLMTGSLGMDPSVVLKGSANVDKLRSRNTSSPPTKPKDDSSSDSKGGGGGGGGSEAKKEDSSSSSKKKEGGGGWAPPPMSASTSGGDVGAAASVAKSATAVHAHSGGPRTEAGGGGQKWGSSINLSANRRASSGVRGGGTVGFLWPRGGGAVSVVARRALSVLDAGARVLRQGLHKCAPYVSCFQVPPAGDYYFLQSASSRR